MNAHVNKAISFAAKAHQGQVRKGTDTPYITHPFGVAALLLESGASDNEVIAGLLHDTLEDTDVTEEEIGEQFGDEVLMIVQGASESNKNASWAERKVMTLHKLPGTSRSVRKVVAADKLHNVMNILGDYEVMGEGLWERFNAPKEDILWYYHSLTHALDELNDPEPLSEMYYEKVHELLEATKTTINELDDVATRILSSTKVVNPSLNKWPVIPTLAEFSRKSDRAIRESFRELVDEQEQDGDQ